MGDYKTVWSDELGDMRKTKELYEPSYLVDELEIELYKKSFIWDEHDILEIRLSEEPCSDTFPIYLLTFEFPLAFRLLDEGSHLNSPYGNENSHKFKLKSIHLIYPKKLLFTNR